MVWRPPKKKPINFSTDPKALTKAEMRAALAEAAKNTAKLKRPKK